MTDRPEDSEHPCIGGNVRIQAMRADLLASSSLIPDWPTPPGVRALTTLRGPLGGSQGAYARFNMGTRAGDDPATVHGNRCDLAAGACLRSWPHWLHQVHGTRVWQADALLPWPQRWDTPHAEPDADAAITRTPGVVLAILSADCLPVL
ncbi:MAG: laccase domain-containing protein, partial [Metallibacterium scheffleri]